MKNNQQDLRNLEVVASKIQDHLKENKAPITLRNVVQAMFETNYADWIGGDEIYPQCEYETEANGLRLTSVLTYCGNFFKRVTKRKAVA